MIFSFEGVDCSGKDVMAERFAKMNGYEIIPDVSPIIKSLGIKNRQTIDIVVKTQLHFLTAMAEKKERYVIVRGFLTGVVYDKFHKDEFDRNQYELIKALISAGNLHLFFVDADLKDLKKRWADREKHYKEEELLKIREIYEEFLNMLYVDNIDYHRIKLFAKYLESE